jgi:hypothetical protein
MARGGGPGSRGAKEQRRGGFTLGNVPHRHGDGKRKRHQNENHDAEPARAPTFR